MANTTFFSTNSLIGIAFETTTTTPQFALGTVAEGNGNSQWVYVQASGAIAQYDIVKISTAYVATSTVLATASFGDVGAVSCATAFASGEYGWVCRRGMGSAFKANVLANCVANTQLYTTTVAGGVDDSTVTGADAVNGLVITANAGGSAAAVTCEMTGVSFGAQF